MLLIEQPITRAQALSKPVHPLAQDIAVEIDEF